MGFMYHLAKTKVMTLLQFKELVETTDVDYFRQLIDYMNKLMEENEIANVILDDLEYEYFEKIAKKLSPVPWGTHTTQQRTWKNVAATAGVGESVIKALNTPTQQDLEQLSLTEEFFSYMSAADPELEVAFIAQTLLAIKRNDVVSCKMFQKCREQGCLKIPSKKAVKDAEEQRKRIADQKERIQDAAENLENLQ